MRYSGSAIIQMFQKQFYFMGKEIRHTCSTEGNRKSKSASSIKELNYERLSDRLNICKTSSQTGRPGINRVRAE